MTRRHCASLMYSRDRMGHEVIIGIRHLCPTRAGGECFSAASLSGAISCRSELSAEPDVRPASPFLTDLIVCFQPVQPAANQWLPKRRIRFDASPVARSSASLKLCRVRSSDRTGNRRSELLALMLSFARARASAFLNILGAFSVRGG
jgi:hypothetical protein